MNLAMTTAMMGVWTAEHVRAIAGLHGPATLIPAVAATDRSALDPARLYWDMWPVQDVSGHRVTIAGRELWMALTAPDRGDPALRHFEAKIHWLERKDECWHDLGPVLPSDRPVPYEREWAGSALLDDGVVTLFFTAAGTATRAGGYQQELWAAHARIGADGWPGEWSDPAPLVTGYGPHYMPADAHEGEAGKIKAFRDPAYFRDPADGAEYIAFTASLAGSDSAFNGALGMARRTPSGWVLTPPCLHAEGVNNELERAHLVFHAKHYYAFWSTQTATFAEGLRHAPGGLYGMVADSMAGPWRPLNGTGLVLANPADRPQQTYSWYVDASLTVCSFVDVMPDGGFGGVPAPLMQLELDGERAMLRSAAAQGAA
jgi:levansucrase